MVVSDYDPLQKFFGTVFSYPDIKAAPSEKRRGIWVLASCAVIIILVPRKPCVSTELVTNPEGARMRGFCWSRENHAATAVDGSLVRCVVHSYLTTTLSLRCSVSRIQV